ncbi:MAG: hypothetical protein NXI24_14040 [bacterium]|nr:hypothetical protein [bacterium]
MSSFRATVIAVGLLALSVFIPEARLLGQGPVGGTDLKISNIRLDPGSVLSETQTLYIGYDLSFSYPERLFLCVQPQAGWEGSFMGCPGRSAGKDEIYATINSAGPQKLDSLRFVAMDENHRVVYERAVPVDMEFTEQAGYAKIREQGIGAKILSVEFLPATPARLDAKQKLNVSIKYEVPDGAALRVWALPMNSCDCIYESSIEEPRQSAAAAKAQKTVVRWIEAAAGAHIRKVKVKLANQAGVILAEEYIDVDFRFGPESDAQSMSQFPPSETKTRP